MGSIGGLDVAYGASTQIVKTNTLVVEVDATKEENTVAAAATVLSRCQEVMPSAIAPDYIALVADDVLTEGYYDAHNGDISDNGVLKHIQEVPVAGGSFGATANKQRGLAYDHILNVGILQLNTDNEGAADDLFKEGSPADESIAGEFTFASSLQGQLMSAQLKAASYTSGISGTHGVGGADGRVSTLNLTELLTDSAVLGGTKIANISTITATSTLDAINHTLTGSAAIVQITSLASLV